MSKPKFIKVPSVADLAERGLAKPVEHTKTGKPTHWKIKKKGYEFIRAAESNNAAILRPLIDDVAAKRAVLLKAQSKLTKAETANKAAQGLGVE